ncbi:unnamed protein product, partial [marine sediment metagenome]
LYTSLTYKLLSKSWNLLRVNNTLAFVILYNTSF